MKNSRRTFLKHTAALTAALTAGHGLLPRILRAEPKPQASPLRSIPELSSNRLTAAPTNVELWPETETNVLSLNGSYPGPLIRINRGERLQLELENNLADDDLIVHWHGLFAPEEMDGHPRHAIGPGETYAYDFLVDQRAGTFWYHSHTDMKTAPQVYNGLAGFFIVHDEEEAALGLPAGEFDVPLLIQDKQVEGAQFVYDPGPLDIMRGWQGDDIFVNGTPEARLSVRQTLYRFRLLNGSNARVWQIGFGDGRPFHLIANDGGLLEAPITIDSLFLPPGARADILVDFSADTIGSGPLLRSLAFDGDTLPGTRQGEPADLMRFVVAESGPAAPAIPGTLSTIEHLSEDDAVRTREFRLHMNQDGHAINDLVFDMNRVDFDVPMGETEIWEFFNPSQAIHPMHVHGVHFQILEKNGSSDLAPEELGWKDTVLLFPYDRIRVLLRFDAHPGIFMLHCHNLEHEDDGMMMNFRVTPPASVHDRNASDRYLRATPNVASDRTTIHFGGSGDERLLTVTDASGRERMRERIAPGRAAADLDLSRLSVGSYWCRVGTEAVRIIVAR